MTEILGKYWSNELSSCRLSRGFALRLATALLTAYLTLINGLCCLYVHQLIHPVCPPPTSEQPGFETLTLLTGAGNNLTGWWHTPQNGAVILLIGGHAANRDAMLGEATLLASKGFGTMTLDARHCAGQLVTLGYDEKKDLMEMATYARSRSPLARLGVMGFSTGGTAAILGTAEMPQIEAVIAIGNYSNLREEIRTPPASFPSLRWQVQQLIPIYYTLFTGILPRNVSPQDALPLISPRPVLLIHGEYEIQSSGGRDQLAAAGEPKELWIVPGAGHGGYSQTQPQAFEQRVTDFFEEHLVP